MAQDFVAVCSSPGLGGCDQGFAEEQPANSAQPESRRVLPPPELRDPISLARWALQQAALKLSQKPVHLGVPGSMAAEVFFAWEHPRDPQEYMPRSARPLHGWASWWTFDEWQYFKGAYGVYEARFDQGKLGHVRPKPSMLATTSWFLFESLEGQLLTEAERSWFGKGPLDVRSRLQESASWARWAPGLTSLVWQAWNAWALERGLWTEVEARKGILAKLTHEEQLRRHADQDHTPFRKGCPVCIASQGRQRSHWRASATGLYSASFDLAGPYIAGQGYDPVASGRDKGQEYRYFLACAFTVPVQPLSSASTPDPDCADETELRKKGDEAGSAPSLAPDLPSWQELFGPDEAELDTPADVFQKAVTHRVRSKGPEGGGLPLDKTLGPVIDADPPLPPPPGPPPEMPLTRTLCMGMPLRTKAGKEVLPAVQATVNRLEAYGFPVHRYHADRAKELRSAALVTWLRSRGVHTSWTPGDSPAGNKAELAVQQLKSAARKLLDVAKLDISFWPLAVLHSSNRNWCNLCESLGVPQPVLLPFGVPLHARRRATTGYRSHWVSRTVLGTYLGQAPCTPGGHLVWVPDDKGGHKIMLTNTVYPLRPAPSERRPRFRIFGKRGPPLVLKPVSLARVSLLPQVQVCGNTPGGEWVDGQWVDGQDVYGTFCDFDVGDGCEGGVALAQLQTPVQDIEPSSFASGIGNPQEMLRRELWIRYYMKASQAPSYWE